MIVRCGLMLDFGLPGGPCVPGGPGLPGLDWPGGPGGPLSDADSSSS